MPEGGRGLPLERFPLHLGLGATAEPQPEFPDDERAMQWYADYASRTIADGSEGRLVSFYEFDRDWDSWEMHPQGAEIVLCTKGYMVVVQEKHDVQQRITLHAGEYAVNPPGTWHTADVPEPSAALFITPGLGTQHRPR